MNQGRFCTLVLGDDEQIYRVLLDPGHQPTYGSLLDSGQDARCWNYGRCVEIPFARTCIGTRPTHPEDSVVAPNACKLVNQTASPGSIAYHARAHSYQGPVGSFPGIIIEWNKAFYKGSPTLERSAAFWEVAGARIVNSGAPGHEKKQLRVFTRDHSDVILPIKDPTLLQAVETGQIAVGDHVPARLVMVGLASPFPHSSGEDRTYMQLLQITV